MAKAIHLPVSLLLSALSIIFSNAADSSLNIACGVSGNFTDSQGNKWVGDGSFADIGLPGKVSSYYSVSPPLNTLRYFPGRSVCYGFNLAPRVGKVTVTTQFYYGNYDSNYYPPTFYVKYDSNEWTEVATSLSGVVKYTLTYTTTYDKIYVCLGVPQDDFLNVPFVNTLQISGPGVNSDNNKPNTGNDTHNSSGNPTVSLDHGKKNHTVIIAIVVSIVVGLALLVGLGMVLFCLSNQRRRNIATQMAPVRPDDPPEPPRSRLLEMQSGFEMKYPQPQGPGTAVTYSNNQSNAEENYGQALDPATPESAHSNTASGVQQVSLKGTGNDNRGRLVQIDHVFTYNEISKITDNFRTRIGKGGSGVVYYGRLKDGREVAVKVLNESLPQGAKEFVSEVQLLLTVHHKCIAGFVGYCEEGQSLILIYEYMKGGNLRELLSAKNSKSAFLTWEKRLQIAQRVATGLDYLHSDCEQPIIHRDVKTTNVLLNHKMEAKIADFGLSKAGLDEDLTYVSTVVAGTPGYIDPEYYQTNRLTTGSDVYSFGVVLLELISGHCPIMCAPDGRRFNLVQWAIPLLGRHDLESVADPNLRGQYNVDSMRKVAHTAVLCTLEASDQRPTMSDVVSQLKEAMEVQTRQGGTPADGMGGFAVPSTLVFNEFSPASTSSTDYSVSLNKGFTSTPLAR